jgi:hypothetical protein
MPTLYACYAHAAGRRGWVVAFGLLTFVTLFGSVYLAWHYAVDGYAAILGTLGLWWLTGRFSRTEASPVH